MAQAFEREPQNNTQQNEGVHLPIPADSTLLLELQHSEEPGILPVDEKIDTSTDEVLHRSNIVLLNPNKSTSRSLFKRGLFGALKRLSPETGRKKERAMYELPKGDRRVGSLIVDGPEVVYLVKENGEKTPPSHVNLQVDKTKRIEERLVDGLDLYHNPIQLDEDSEADTSNTSLGWKDDYEQFVVKQAEDYEQSLSKMLADSVSDTTLLEQ